MNCGYGRGFSVLEVLDAVERVAGGRIDAPIRPRRPGDPDGLIADNRRILDASPGGRSCDDLDTIVADALRWERGLEGRRAAAQRN